MNTFKKLIHRIAIPAYATIALLASTSPGWVHADDTDIYINNTPTPASAPLVMFSIDYRSNLGSTICGDAHDAGCAVGQYFLADTETAPWVPTGRTFVYFDMLRLALHKVLSDITGVRVGLMMNHDSSNNCAGPNETNCSGGGYIVKGFKQLEEGDTNFALRDFTTTLFALPTPQGNLAHTYQGKELYFEFFRYLTGQGVYNGHNGWTDYGTNSSNNLDVDFPAASWDTTIETASVGNPTYISPLEDSNACAKIFAINFLFQVSNQEDDSDNAINASKDNGGMAGISSGADFTETIAYMNDIDLADGEFGTTPDLAGAQNVTSYFITDKQNTTTNGYAAAGGTQNALGLTNNPEELVNTLTAIFKEIISVSTTFVAASVPVNVFNRAESLDNVYIALFQADPDGRPLWAGNLKKLKLLSRAQDDGSKIVELVDKGGDPAIANDGRIRFDAVTHWTSVDDLPLADTDEGEVEDADGRVVDRGAAGQRIPGFVAGTMGASNPVAAGEPPDAGPRKIFYDNGSALTALNADETTATTLQTAFGAASVTDAKKYLYWLRGYTDSDSDGAYDDVRSWDTSDGTPWILGDPLHSRPLPINYGARDGHTVTNPLIYIAMASNDGYMHFFRNTTSAVDAKGNGVESGKEVWAFVPTAVMGEIKKLVDNTALTTSPRHPYTVDGAPAVWLNDNNGNGTLDSGESGYLYFGLRRGGRTLYALNISEPNAPTLEWKIDNNTAGFGELGQTWSRPQVGMVDHDDNGIPDPVIIFAGGYDTNKDTRGGVGTNDTMGNAIYVVDADDGTLIWKTVQGSGGRVSDSEFQHVNMVDSIPSDVTVVDTNGDLQIDRILVGDTGGNIWRSDIDGPRSEWQTILLATIGRHSAGALGTADDRRFFHRPDFVPSKDENGPFDAVIIGSGDRPNPLDKAYASKPQNFLYMIKDRDITPPTVAAPVEDTNWDHTSFTDITDNCIGQGDCTTTPDLSNGWKLALEAGDGEKSLSTPLTLSNTIYFTSYLPKGKTGDETTVTTTDEDGNVLLEAATCGPSEGSGLLYAINLGDGTAVKNYNTSDDADEGEQSTSDRFTDLGSAGIPADVVGINFDGKAYVLPPDLKPKDAGADTRWRTFWYETEENNL